MSRNIYDTPTTSMYMYNGLYNRKRRQFFDRPDVQAKGLMAIRSRGDRIQKNANYNMAPADGVRPLIVAALARQKRYLMSLKINKDFMEANRSV